MIAWWRQEVERDGVLGTLRRFSALTCEFLRDSTPQRRRQRYGDVDYDWERRVDTTAATVGWRDRLAGMFLSPYQATDPALFHEMLTSLDIDFREFTFIDIGSGKGRVLLMAAEYPFRRIVGVEILGNLHRVALGNIQRVQGGAAQSAQVEALCLDASQYEFPAEPLVVYLFNPLPEPGLKRMLRNLEDCVARGAGPVFVLYHNPLLERVLSQSQVFTKKSSNHQYAVFELRH